MHETVHTKHVCMFSMHETMLSMQKTVLNMHSPKDHILSKVNDFQPAGLLANMHGLHVQN